MGPEAPTEPALPAFPAGEGPAYERAKDEFLFQLHMTRAKAAIAQYANAHANYRARVEEFNAFGGKPKQISVFSNEAKEMKARDPRRYRDTPA